MDFYDNCGLLYSRGIVIFHFSALHNAICAGHFDIVKFLVEFGCDVNAQDSDGWTPLHCAASCNNLAMVYEKELWGRRTKGGMRSY